MATKEVEIVRVGEGASKLYVGWRAELVRPDLIPEVKAPVNYKDPAKIQEYIKTWTPVREKENQEAAGLASLSEIVVLDKNGEGPVFKASGVGRAAVKFQEFLITNWSSRHIGTGDYPAWIRACRAQKLFALLAYDLLSWPVAPVLVYPELTCANYLKPNYDMDSSNRVFGNPFNFLSPSGESFDTTIAIANGTWFKGEEPIQFGSPLADALACYRLCNKLKI